MGLAADALELAQVDRDDLIAYQTLLGEYLAQGEFLGWDRRKIQYAILTGAALRGGIKPDLLNDTAWRTDDYWRYALFAAVAVIRACAVRLEISEAELAERLAELHGLELPLTNVQSRPRMWPIAAGELRVERLSHGETGRIGVRGVIRPRILI